MTYRKWLHLLTGQIYSVIFSTLIIYQDITVFNIGDRKDQRKCILFEVILSLLKAIGGGVRTVLLVKFSVFTQFLYDRPAVEIRSFENRENRHFHSSDYLIPFTENHFNCKLS